MITKMKIPPIYITVCTFLFVSCISNNDPLLENETGEVCFLVGQDENVGIETRTTYDVNDFNVALKNGSDVIFSNRKFSDIAGTTFSCTAKDGYVFTAESCTEIEAESANGNWGQPRFAGTETFEVLKNQRNEIEVICKQINSSMQVVFSDFIHSFCTDYSITFYAADDIERQFTIDKNNYLNKIAYFNIDESRAVNYTVSLSFAGQTHEFPGNSTIVPSSKYSLNVKLDDESFSVVSIGITVNGELDNEITLEAVNINPYQ